MDKTEGAGRAGQRLVFSGENNLTFVNYDGSQDYTYRRTARLHNAHRRAQRNTRQGRKLSVKEVNDGVKVEKPGVTAEVYEPVVPAVTDTAQKLNDIPPRNDQREANKIISEWSSIFTEHFCLPEQVSTIDSSHPGQVFLAAAQQDTEVYRNLVLLPVFTSRVRRGEISNQTVYQQQAQLLKDFRQLAEKYTQPSNQLSRKDFQRFMATTFAFHAHDFDKASAYDAIMYSNATIFLRPEVRLVRQLPTVEWIRTIMPLPGSDFEQPPSYRSEMLSKINMLLDFLQETRSLIEKKSVTAFAQYFSAGTNLYKIASIKLPDVVRAESYNGFYIVCQHRVLSMINAMLNRIDNGSLTDQESLLEKLQHVAGECLRQSFPYNLTSFLWYLIVLEDAQEEAWDGREPLISWCVRELVSVHNLSFCDHLLWLLEERAGITSDISRNVLDLNTVRQSMKGFYELDV